jgi:hypothetical protein
MFEGRRRKRGVNPGQPGLRQRSAHRPYCRNGRGKSSKFSADLNPELRRPSPVARLCQPCFTEGRPRLCVYGIARTTIVSFCPPNPKLLLRHVRTFVFRGVFGM